MPCAPPATSDPARRGFRYLVLACLAGDFVALHVDGLRSYAAGFEWVLIAQVFVLWPLVYFTLVFPRTREKASLLACIAVGMLFGSLALDASWKHAWRYVDDLRWVLMIAVAALEIVVMTLLLRSLYRLRHADSPEQAISETVRRFIGERWIARLMAMEFGMWYYALLSWRRKAPLRFEGDEFFPSWRHQGNASNQKGFLWLIGAEIPIAHVLLSLWRPHVALVVTALSVYGWLWLLGEYRATLLRPVSLDDRNLYLRYGLLGNETVPVAAIASVQPCSVRPRRRSGQRRHAAGGTPNVWLRLRDDTQIDHVFGSARVHTIVLAVDDPGRLIASLKERLHD